VSDHLDPRPLSEMEPWLEEFTRYWNHRLSDLEDVLDNMKEEAWASPRFCRFRGVLTLFEEGEAIYDKADSGECLDKWFTP
jgi:hypothetical protein